MNHCPPPPSSPQCRPGLLRVLVVLAVSLLVTALLLWLTASRLVAWRAGARQEVEQRIAAIREAGLPADPEALNRWPVQVPDAENAAVQYTNAIAHIAPEGGPGAVNLQLPAAEAWDEIRSVLQQNQAALGFARRAAAFSRARYPIHFVSDLRPPELPHHDGLMQLAQMLEWEAALEARAGDSLAACQAIDAGLALARSLDDEPLLQSQWTAMVLWGVACRSLEGALGQRPLPANALRSFAEQLAAAEATNRLVVGLIGERALNLGRFRALSGKAEGSVFTVVAARIWQGMGYLDRDEAFYLRAMETNIAVARVLPPAALGMTNELQGLPDAAEQRMFLVSRKLLPTGRDVVMPDAICRAMLRTALAGVAVERWRAMHEGALPDSLDALVPSVLAAVPTDPFDGLPLRYKRLERGYVIYSVGENGKDDGGLEFPPGVGVLRKEDKLLDIAFTIGR